MKIKAKAIIETHSLPYKLLGLLSHKLTLRNPIFFYLPLVNRLKERQNHRLLRSLNRLPVANNIKIGQCIVTGRSRLENDNEDLQRGAVVLEVEPEVREGTPNDIVLLVLVCAGRHDVDGKVIHLMDPGRRVIDVGPWNLGPSGTLLPVEQIDLLVDIDGGAGQGHGPVGAPIYGSSERPSGLVDLKDGRGCSISAPLHETRLKRELPDFLLDLVLQLVEVWKALIGIALDDDSTRSRGKCRGSSRDRSLYDSFLRVYTRDLELLGLLGLLG